MSRETRDCHVSRRLRRRSRCFSQHRRLEDSFDLRSTNSTKRQKGKCARICQPGPEKERKESGPDRRKVVRTCNKTERTETKQSGCARQAWCSKNYKNRIQWKGMANKQKCRRKSQNDERASKLAFQWHRTLAEQTVQYTLDRVLDATVWTKLAVLVQQAELASKIFRQGVPGVLGGSEKIRPVDCWRIHTARICQPKKRITQDFTYRTKKQISQPKATWTSHIQNSRPLQGVSSRETERHSELAARQERIHPQTVRQTSMTNEYDRHLI